MKRWLTGAAALILCLALVIGVACGGGDGEEEGVETLKFGCGVIMTGGGGGAAGFPFRCSLEMAEESIGEFEVAGERYVWDFITEDNNCDVAGGVASTNKFLYEYGVDFMFHACADSGIAASMITEELDPPMILFHGASSIFDFGPDYPHTFGIILLYDLEILPLFDWLSKEHPEVKRVAITYDESKTGQAMYNAAEAACDYYGLELDGEAVPTAIVEYYPVASKIMTHEPDLVIGGLDLFKAMWDMGYEGFCVNLFWSAVAWGDVPWDKAGGKLLITCPHAIGELWPEVAAWAVDYEYRYGAETTPAVLLGLTISQIMTQALQKAGTVDDVERIVEVLQTETFETGMGPIYFGCEQIIGIPNIAIYPEVIWEVVAKDEYQPLKVYTPEEVEAIANEVWGARD